MAHYTGHVSIESSSRTIEANIQVTVKRSETGGVIVFYLPTNTQVKSVSAEGMGHYEVKRDSAWSPFVSGDTKLLLEFSSDQANMSHEENNEADERNALRESSKTKEVVIDIGYRAVIEALPEGGMNTFTQDYIEIGVYVPWFPLLPTFEQSTFDVQINDTNSFYIGGPVQRNDGGWRLNTIQECVGYPILGAKDFYNNCKVSKACKSEVRVFYTNDVDYKLVEGIHTDVTRILSLFSEWFGQADIRELDILLSPRKNTDSGGGYCRPGLIVLPCGGNESSSSKYAPGDDIYMFKYLAHELGHLWWNKASVTTWENWLNESFAEYACLIAVRELVDTVSFDRLINDYGKKTENSGPLFQCSADREDHFEVWYMKGPVMLNALEKEMGESHFKAFLKSLVKNKITSTKDVLDALDPSHKNLLWNLLNM